MEKAADAMKRSYDAGKCPSHEYSKGDLVWLDTRNLKMDRPSKKLDNKQVGPFMIEEKVGLQDTGSSFLEPGTSTRSSMSCC